MSDVWVVNASPLIVLAKAGLEDLLTELSGELIVPQAVAEEVLAGPKSDRGRELIESGWGRRILPERIPDSVLEWGLGAGETAVITVGLQTSDCTVALDDGLGRACARSHGLSLVGTLGIILQAKRRGLVRSAAESLAALRSHGLHLDSETIRASLRSVGEEWSF